MDRSGLTSYLGQLDRIGDWLRPAVEVAPTARRQVHSGLFPSLQNAQHTEPDRQQ